MNMNRLIQRTLILLVLSSVVAIAAREAQCANTYYVRGSHSHTINASSTETTITLVRTSGRDSADVFPVLVPVKGTGFAVVNDQHFNFSRYSFDSTATIDVYFYTQKYHDTSVALLIIPLGSTTDTIRFVGTDPRFEPPLPNGSCYSMWVWGQNLTLGSLDSSQDPNTYKWDYSWDYTEIPGGVTPVTGASLKRVHVRIIGDESWYFTTQTSYDPTLGSVGPQELYTNSGFYLGYKSHGVEYDTALVIAESDGGSCSQRDTIVVHMHDRMPAHVWQKLEVGNHDIGEVKIGDTQCIDIPIINTTGKTLTIDSIAVTSYYPPDDDWSHSLPTLPMTLQVGDTTYIHLCYHAIHYNRTPPYGTSPITQVGISYSDSVHHQGGVHFTASASTPANITFAQDTIRVNDVMVDGYTDLTFNIYHQDDSGKTYGKFLPWLWSEDLLSYDEWHLMSDSVQLHPFDTIPVTVRFAPYEVGSSWVMVEYFQGSYPNSPVIIGRAIEQSKDSLGLFTAPEESVLTLKTQASVTTRTFYFTNNSGADLSVTAVTLSTGAHFQITGMTPSTLPAHLAAGDVLAIDVQFSGDTNGFYRDSLIVTTENSLTSTVFELQALREPASRVASSTDGTELLLSPTPVDSRLTVRMNNAAKVTYDILDLLGQRVISATGSSEWSASVGHLTAGSYVLRASGIDRAGKPFLTSRMFIKR
jgi:hypothetical protein